jgi:hypothetical protein
MPRAVAPAIRQAICRRHRNGQAVARIAEELALPERSVRHVLQQFRLRGEEAWRANYQACGKRRVDVARPVRQRTLRLREQHPRWGAGRLRIELLRWFAEHEVPCTRTLQRWLRTTRRAPSGRPVGTSVSRAEHPHDVWQTDAAEQKRLASGAGISWLRVADECSGAVLKSFVFPPRTLHASFHRSRADVFETGFCRVRLAARDAGRQWSALGFMERLTHGSCTLAHRLRHRHALEHAAQTTGEWRDRTEPGPGQCLGGTKTMPHCAPVSAAIEPRRSSAA